MDEQNKLSPFEGKEIRKVWHDEQWYFSIVDIIEVLTNSPNPSRYWTNMKSREKELYPNWVKLKFVKHLPVGCGRGAALMLLMARP